MMNEPQTEYWLAGPIEGISAVLQPVGHAILQAHREIRDAIYDLPAGLIWVKPAGAASIAFHLQHIPGVLDRLFTYARGEKLSTVQFEYLKKEGVLDDSLTVNALLEGLQARVDACLEELKAIPGDRVFDTRLVGRKEIPSNMLGLLFHAAEHMQRHTGQLLVTAKVVRSNYA